MQLVAWQAITSLPLALESVLMLLAAVIQDECISSSAQSIRQDYSAALIRTVNGVVDPLQVGFYARSIASIASQVGLPAWLVELRHAGTHEELPPLQLLRDGASEVR